MPTSRIDMTCMGMSNDVDTAGSVCEMAMRVTVRSAPATVLTEGGTTVTLIARAACWSISPVEPEEAPGSEPRLSNPADQPVGDSRKRSYPIGPFPSLVRVNSNVVELSGCTGTTL